MNDLKNKVPFYLTLIAAIALTSFATLKLQHWKGSMFFAGMLSVLLYLIWLFGESNLSVGETRQEDTSRDKGTCELYAFGRLLTVLCALWGETYWESLNFLMITGFLVFVGGIAFRLKALSMLGAFDSDRVHLAGEPKVLNEGPYSFVRHPAYSGMILAHVGFVLLFFNIWAFLALTGVLIPSIVARIMIEEESLYSLEGYKEYAETHKRLLPFVW